MLEQNYFPKSTQYLSSIRMQSVNRSEELTLGAVAQVNWLHGKLCHRVHRAATATALTLLGLQQLIVALMSRRAICHPLSSLPLTCPLMVRFESTKRPYRPREHVP
jgi:hypothetical protein